MNPVLRNYLLPGLLMIGILVAWDFTKPRNPGHFAEIEFKPEELPNGGVPPWNAGEESFQNGRNQIRKSTMRGLDQAWSTFCDAKGRQQLVDAVAYYFGQRSQQEKSYPAKWGKEGRDYIDKQWATADDQRIERLVQELYWRGYLNPHDLRPSIAERIAPLLKDTRVMAEPCKN